MRTANNSATWVCHGHIPTNLHILLPTICRNEINDADNLSQKSEIAELGRETNRDRPSRWLRERNSGESCRAALVRNPARAIDPPSSSISQLYLYSPRGSGALSVSILMSGILRQGPTADALIQRIEELGQPAVSRLTSGHLEQDFAHFRGDVFDRPADLAISDGWIAGVVKLQCQGGIGRWTDNVLGLVDIR